MTTSRISPRFHRAVPIVATIGLLAVFSVSATAQLEAGKPRRVRQDPLAQLQVGARLDTADGRLTVVYPMVASPAEQAGLQRGDVITAVNGAPTNGSFTEFNARLETTENPLVKIELQRRDSIFTVPVTRIRLDSLFVLWGITKDTTGRLSLPSPQPGQPAPRFRNVTTTGHPIELEDFRGRYLLLDFWATWCPPCRKEMPNVVRLADEYAPKGLSVVGISSDRKRIDLIKGIASYKIGFPQVYQGPTAEISYAYGVRSIPRTFLIDPDGTIVAVGLRGNQLRQKLTQLLGPTATNN